MSKESLAAVVDPEQVRGWIAELGSDSSAAVPLLQAIQAEYGYLPRPAMDLVVAETEIHASQLYGVATFYSQFRLDPVGRHLVRICNGTACHVQGADRVNTSLRHALDLSLEGAGQDTADNGSYTLEFVACIGCCSLAPVMLIGDRAFPNLRGADALRHLKQHARQHNEILPRNTPDDGDLEAAAAARPAARQGRSP